MKDIMQKHLMICILFVYGLFSYGQNSDIRLELKSNREKVFLGERVVVTLRIWDSNIIQLMKNEKFKIIEQNQIDKMIGKTTEMAYKYPSGFNYFMEIEPIDTGKIKLGPFTIEYQKKVLISNEILIQVLQKKEKNYLIYDIPSRFYFDSTGLIRIRSHEIDIKNLELKGSSYYQVVGQHNFKSTKPSREKTETEYLRSFNVKFIRKGIIELNRDYLINIPDSCYIEPVIIKIE